VREQLKAAFTKFPFCLATYVCLIGAGWLLFAGWKPVRNDFPVYESARPSWEAQEAANKLGGKVWAVGYTGSMKPLLQGGEYVVTVGRFDEVKVGDILVYSATYHDKPIIHRAALKDKHGWLMSGDSSRLSESWSRVTKDNYLGTAVVGYRLKTN